MLRFILIFVLCSFSLNIFATEIQSCSLRTKFSPFFSSIESSSASMSERALTNFSTMALSILHRGDAAVVHLGPTGNRLEIYFEKLSPRADKMIEKLGLNADMDYYMNTPLPNQGPVVKQLGKLIITCEWKRIL